MIPATTTSGRWAYHLLTILHAYLADPQESERAPVPFPADPVQECQELVLRAEVLLATEEGVTIV